KSFCREHVAVSSDRDVVSRKSLLKDCTGRQARESPIIAPAIHIVAADLTDTGTARQQDSSWLQYPVNSAHGRAYVVNELQCLGEDNAVKSIRCDGVVRRQIRNDRRLRTTCAKMEYLGSSHPITAKPRGVVVIGDVKNTSMNVVCMAAQEVFDIVPIDALPPLEAEYLADWSQPPEIAESHPANRRPHAEISLLLPEPCTNVRRQYLF